MTQAEKVSSYLDHKGVIRLKQRKSPLNLKYFLIMKKNQEKWVKQVNLCKNCCKLEN
jgi:hypothetical protein